VVAAVGLRQVLPQYITAEQVVGVVLTTMHCS